MGFVHYEMLGWVLQPAIQYLRVAAKCFQLEHLESQLPLLANVSTLPKVSSTTGQVLLFKGSELYHINKTNIKQTIKHHPYPLQTSQHQQEPKSKALHYMVPQAACPSLTACLANAYTLLQKEIKQSSKDFLLHFLLKFASCVHPCITVHALMFFYSVLCSHGKRFHNIFASIHQINIRIAE